MSLTAAAAAAGGVVAIAAGVVRNDTRTLAAVTLVAALSFVGSGLVAWRRRPDVWTGALMIAAGFALFAGSLANSNSALPFTIGLVLAPLPSAIIGHLILSFPEGRLHSTLERLVVAGAYFVVFVVQIVMLMFMGFEHVTGCPCPTNLLFIRDDMALHSAIMSTQRFLGIVLAIAAAWIVVRRWQNASGPLAPGARADPVDRQRHDRAAARGAARGQLVNPRLGGGLRQPSGWRSRWCRCLPGGSLPRPAGPRRGQRSGHRAGRSMPRARPSARRARPRAARSRRSSSPTGFPNRGRMSASMGGPSSRPRRRVELSRCSSATGSGSRRSCTTPRSPRIRRC